jgi:uncharacterized phage protein gp47/JayE
MAFKIPSLADILERTRQSFKSNMPETDPWVWPNNIYVSAKVIAERIWEAMHRIGYVQKQAFPLTATGEFLDLHAQQYGITRKAASAASGTVYGVGGTVGAIIPAGAILTKSDGTEYTVDDDVTVQQDGSYTLYVTASSEGVDGNFEYGGSLRFQSAILGVGTGVTVTAEYPLAGGAPLEDDESLRERLLQRLQYPPHAGSRQDYIRWAKEITGVTDVWIGRNAFGPGTVGIWFLFEDAIPNAAQVEMVQEYIAELAPIAANPVVMAPIPEPVRIEITGFSPNTAAAKAAAKAEIKDMIEQKRDVTSTGDQKYMRQSWFWQAVANATGERYHKVTLPNDDIPITIGHIPVYDETWITIK